jgi:hypothetical protein
VSAAVASEVVAPPPAEESRVVPAPSSAVESTGVDENGSRDEEMKLSDSSPVPMDEVKAIVSTNVDNNVPSNSKNADSLLVQMELRGKTAPPMAERMKLIEKAHLVGHFGREALFKKLFNDGYWWPKMRSDIEEVLRDCDSCIRYVVTKDGYHPSSFICSSGPGVHWQVDMCVHLPPSPEGYVALLVLIDVFTGFVLLRAVKDTAAPTIISRQRMLVLGASTKSSTLDNLF